VQALAAGGGIAAAVTAAGELVILAGDRPAVRLSAHPNRATAVAVSDDGGLVVTGTEDGAVRAFSPAGEPLGEATVGDRVEGLAAGSDGLILVASRPGAERRVTALRA
jgi:sugar lactone lactonase YvrE